MTGIKKQLARSVSRWGVINEAALLLAGMANRMQFIYNMYVRMDDDGTENIKETLQRQLVHDDTMMADFSERLIECIETLVDTMDGRDIISESDDPLINQFNKTKRFLELLKKNSD